MSREPHETAGAVPMDDFACDIAVGELGPTRESRGLSGARGTQEDFFESYELAATAVSLAMLPAIEPMPSGLRSRVLDSLQREMAAAGASRGWPTDAARGPSRGHLGPIARLWKSPALAWAAAAAAIVVASVAWFGPTRATPPGFAAQRQQFVSATQDVGVWNWVDFAHPATQEAPEITGVKGDVVWSSAKQEGFLRLTGLPRNSRDVERYQLWIIDKRGLEQRVNAGLFDSTGEETIVHFKPELKVDGPVIFAVTIEPPEGVVVSSLKRRVCAALATKG